MKAIGHRIKKSRKNKRLSQIELAELIGVTQPTIGNWESGHHEPRHASVARIADALGVRRLWLMTGRENPVDGGPIAPPVVSEQDSYLTTPIVHVAVIEWPEDVDTFLRTPPGSERHLAASLWALQPFALVCQNDDMLPELPAGTIVIFDAARKKLYDGQIYLFNWMGEAILRRWHNNPDRMEPLGHAPDIDTLFPQNGPTVIARAMQAVRDLV